MTTTSPIYDGNERLVCVKIHQPTKDAKPEQPVSPVMLVEKGQGRNIPSLSQRLLHHAGLV